MILGFKPRFESPILSGTKIHSIRSDISNRWKEGNNIQMATGVRTKKYNCFNCAICTGTQKIEILRTSDYLNETIVKVDGRQLSTKEVQQLARNDGFMSLIDFWLWFSEGYTGKIIHWTDYRY